MAWTVKFTNASGVEQLFTDPPYYKLLTGKKGTALPNLSPITRKIPFIDGVVLEDVQVDEAELDLPILVSGTSQADLWTLINSLNRMLNPKKGLGTLRVTRPDGVEREILCICTSGADPNRTWLVDAEINLVFFCPEGYWRSTTATTLSFVMDQNQPLWFPIFPLNLGSEAIAADFNITNDGDVKTCPTWTIRGPGVDPKLTNRTTGKTLTLTGVTLDETQYITIDTKARKILKNDGTNLFPNLAWGSALWTLEPDINSIRCEMSGTSSVSQIDVTYREYYLGLI